MYHLVARRPEVIDQTSSTLVIVCPDIIIALTIADYTDGRIGAVVQTDEQGTAAERLKDGLGIEVWKCVRARATHASTSSSSSQIHVQPDGSAMIPCA